MLTSVETASSADGVLVPVTIGGQKRNLILDTGGFFSEISARTADSLSLARRNTGLLQYDRNGQPVSQRVEVKDFSLGNIRANSMEFMIGGDSLGGDGTLAPNVLRAYDVEIDFPGNKLGLISPDHCKGQVVYWPNSAAATVPMRVTDAGHIVFPVTLDGKKLLAMLDTSAPRTAIDANTAERVFGIHARAGTQIFRSLVIDGITVSNPDLAISTNLLRAPPNEIESLPSTDGRADAPDILLGLSTLKHLHAYIAYNERMLYFTAGTGQSGGQGDVATH